MNRRKRTVTQAGIERIKVIGVGGVGSILVLFLSQFLSSRKEKSILYLIDGDAYELRNKERMLFDSPTNKAVAKAGEMSRLFGDYVEFYPFPQFVTNDNISRVIEENDAVFLCVDNHASRLLVSEHCMSMKNVVLISGGNDGIENGKGGTFGNVQIHVRRSNGNVTNPLTRFHPEIENTSDPMPREPGCGDLANTSVPQLLFTNLAVASAMLNTYFCFLKNNLQYEEIYLDISLGKMVPVRRRVTA